VRGRGAPLVGWLAGRLNTPTQLATAVWFGVPMVFAALLATPSVGLPGDSLGLRRFQTPQLSPGILLGQTFTMPGDGLYAVEVLPVAVGEQVSGSVSFVLYDVTGGGATRVRGAAVTADSVIKLPSYRFEFPPIGDSADHTYRLDIALAEAEGVAFWATQGERYPGGSMRVNSQERWADLGFRAYAPAPSIGQLLMTIRGDHPVRGNIVMGACTAIWLLLGLLVRTMMVETSAPRRRTESGQTALP
jgi:hypothetical protein